jgi:hypothetical protein
MIGKPMKRVSEFVSPILLIFSFSSALGQPGDMEIVTQLSFGRVMSDQSVEQVVTFDNPTSKKLTVENIHFTPPLVVSNVTPVIEPGGQGKFTLVLSDQRTFGELDGGVQINFEDGVIEPMVFHVGGYVVPPVEFKPRPFFFVVTNSGAEKQASMDIINHRPQPLNIVRAETNSDRFSVTLEPIIRGQQYRLTLLLRGDAPAGKSTEPIRLITDEVSGNGITIQANTFIRERIYTFPESVDMGALPLKLATDHSAVGRLAQTLMIYRPGTDDFEVTASTDLESIEIVTERGPKGDRFELTVTLVPDKIQTGELNGRIYLKTNDEEFSELVIPITGNILTQ